MAAGLSRRTYALAAAGLTVFQRRFFQYFPDRPAMAAE